MHDNDHTFEPQFVEHTFGTQGSSYYSTTKNGKKMDATLCIMKITVLQKTWKKNISLPQ